MAGMPAMTGLGPFAPFLAGWVATMAAMMLPGAAPWPAWWCWRQRSTS